MKKSDDRSDKERVQHLEAQFRRAKQLAERLIESSLTGIVAFDRDYRFAVWNPAMVEMTGFAVEEVIGHDAFERFPFLKEIGEDEAFHRALNGETTVTTNRPYHIPETGRSGMFEAHYSPLRDEGGGIIGGLIMIRDTTEKHRAEQAERRSQAELREVQRQLSRSRESERVRLAQELYDGPVQDLYAAKFQLDALLAMTSDEAQRRQVLAVKEMLQQVNNTLSAISNRLRPPTLAPFGLEVAIRSHAESFQQRNPKVIVNLDLAPDEQLLPEYMRLALFRIYQEALNNIAKHAQAEHVLIRLDILDQRVILEIQDDGVGFHVPRRWIELARDGHLGLVAAAERAEEIGGQLLLFSSPDKGTIVRVTVPMPASAKSGARQTVRSSELAGDR